MCNLSWTPPPTLRDHTSSWTTLEISLKTFVCYPVNMMCSKSNQNMNDTEYYVVLTRCVCRSTWIRSTALLSLNAEPRCCARVLWRDRYQKYRQVITLLWQGARPCHAFFSPDCPLGWSPIVLHVVQWPGWVASLFVFAGFSILALIVSPAYWLLSLRDQLCLCSRITGQPGIANWLLSLRVQLCLCSKITGPPGIANWLLSLRDQLCLCSKITGWPGIANWLLSLRDQLCLCSKITGRPGIANWLLSLRDQLCLCSKITGRPGIANWLRQSELMKWYYLLDKWWLWRTSGYEVTLVRRTSDIISLFRPL